MEFLIFILGVIILCFLYEVYRRFTNFGKIENELTNLLAFKQKTKVDIKNLTLQSEKLGKEKDVLKEELEKKIKESEKEKDVLKNRINKLINEKNILEYEIKRLKIFEEETNKNKIGALVKKIIDKEFESYNRIPDELVTKKRPAIKKADDIEKFLHKEIKYAEMYKTMKYEYDLLFDLFPELEDYIDKDIETETLEEVKENYDYVRNWVTPEEYEKLSENEKNQLALDRYIQSRKKNKWQIGRDYEMFIGYKLQEQGYKINYTGITEKLKDKGRDIIAENDKEILIVQCKYWSKEKVIHEKHICQLYGTAIQYKMESPTIKNIKPAFYTKTVLSETAKKFADYLGVDVFENVELKDFPRIKCNINNGEQIYHLPFDQQYDRTIIDKKGEFFAWNIEEATKKGFRRAKKYFIN